MTIGTRFAVVRPANLRRSAATAPVLQIANVTKRYGAITALDGVSLEVAAGEFFGLLGPNGAGKSTLMSVITGLRRAEAGSVTLEGRPLAARNRETIAALGLVPQTLALYEDLSAEENLRVFGRLYRIEGRALAARVDEVLAAVQLQDCRRDAVKTFSGGMQRRLNLAASLLHRPRLLLCDEPTVGVDPQSRNAIFDLLQRLNREGLTVIYSTHYMEEATRLCSRIGIIDHGRILALGPLEELLTRLPFTEVVSFPRAFGAGPAAAAFAGCGELVARGDQYDLHLAPAVRLTQVFAAAEAAGVPDRALQLKRPSLEDVFLHLTGKSLRE